MSAVARAAAIVVGAVAIVASGGLGAPIAAAVTGALGVSGATLAAVSTGLGLLASFTAKKPSAADATGSQTSFSADPDAGVPLAQGRTGTAGDIVMRRGWDTRDAGDNDRQAFVAVLSLGPIAAIEGQTVDRVPVSYTATGAAIGAFAGFMWSMTQLGALASPALAFGAGAGTPPGVGADFKLSGKAVATWTLRFDTKAKQYQNGVPAPMWTVRGALAYDPTKDSTYPGGNGPHRMADPADTAAYDAAMATWEWTENPYLLGLRWAHGYWQRDVSNPNSTYQRVMGLGSPWRLIDVAAFVEGRNIAAANGWTCGGMIYSRDEKWATMKKILQAGMGEPMPLGARISCIVNAPKVSLATVTFQDVIGAARVSATQPRRNRINTVTPRYRLEENAWQFLPGSPITVPEHVAEDGGKRSKVLDYPFIQNTKQIGTAVRYDIENAREFGPITLPLKLFWMGYKPGDCVTADLPEVGLNKQTILLLNRDLDPPTGVVTFTARSETAAKHPFALGQTATPPPTPGVSGPPLVPVPAMDAWAITATSLISQTQTVPALVVTGAVDASTADAVVIEYRPFVSGQASGAGWASAGIWSVGASRAEIASVRSGTAYEVAISYQRNGVTGGRRIIGPVVTAGPSIDFDGVTGPNRPEPGATVGAPAGTKVGDRPVEQVIAQLDRIDPISSDTADLKVAQKELDEAVDRLRQSDDAAVVALAALRGVVLDGAATQRQMQRAEGKLAAATMQLLLMTDSADARMRDAGFITDPATGKVYAYALDRLGDRQTKVEATLDAQAGQIALRATSAEVDDKILKAVLNPEQVAQLEPLIARIAAVEVVYDALKAEVQTKAELVELTKAVVRITDAEQRISAAEGLIRTKVEQTSFDQAVTRIGAAEQLLQSYGDVSRYGIELRQGRAARAQSDQALLASILGEHQADELRLTAQALLRQELYTKIVDGDALEARARTEIALRVRDLDARSVQDRLLSIEGDRLLGQDIDALGVQTAQQSAEIATLKTASLAAGVGIAGVEQSIRQQVRSQSQADAALLGGVIATDKAEDRFITSLAEIHSQLATTLIAGFQAEAVARQGLRARIDSADARFDQEARSTADRIRAVTELITSLGTRFDDPATGLAATRADLSRLERATSDEAQATAEAIAAMRAIVNDPATGLAATRADLSRLERVTAAASQANVEAIERLEGIVTDPATGLEKTRAALTSLSELVATQNGAALRRLDTLEGAVNDPSTGLPWARGAIADLARVTTSRDDAAAESIRQVRAVLDGVGDVGIQQAFKAVIDRLGKIEGQYTVSMDVNGNLSGFQLIGGAQGPASFNLINTDLRLGKGLLIKNTGAFMSVEGVGFGVAKDLVEWFGPTMSVDQCSRANAITYKAINGDVYTGGSFSAGTLRNGSASSSLAADAVAEVPSFGSNGKPVKYIASWSYYREWTAQYAGTADGLKAFNAAVASFNATSDDGGYTYFGAKDVEQPSSSLTLTRSFGAAYEQLSQKAFTTQQQTMVGLKPITAGEPGNATFTASIGGGFTVLDPTQSTANRTLRLTLARGFTLPDGVIQRLTIVAIEE